MVSAFQRKGVDVNARLDAYGGTALFLAPGLQDLKADHWFSNFGG